MINQDLVDFMKSTHQEIEREYIRIQKRASEDPGTAGDQGEENWATLLKNWLPPTFQIVTKGRVLSHKGIASPQVDIIILQPEYPKHLIDKKLYLSGGVLAIFECKITLKAKHIEDFIKNSVEIKGNESNRTGTPFKELNSKIVYGLLAHSHSWKGEKSTPIENITSSLSDLSRKIIDHPIKMPDVICVSDLATWSASKAVYLPNMKFDKITKVMTHLPSHPKSGYVCYSSNSDTNNPIGSLITILLNRFAWENPQIRPLADYFRNSNIKGQGSGMFRNWPINIYSDEVQTKLLSGKFLTGKLWDEWLMGFEL